VGWDRLLAEKAGVDRPLAHLYLGVGGGVARSLEGRSEDLHQVAGRGVLELYIVLNLQVCCSARSGRLPGLRPLPLLPLHL
jgi:hypothetical protein